MSHICTLDNMYLYGTIYTHCTAKFGSKSCTVWGANKEASQTHAAALLKLEREKKPTCNCIRYTNINAEDMHPSITHVPQ